MEKKIQTLLGIAAKLASDDVKETESCNVSEILLEDLIDTQEICEAIIDALNNNEIIQLVNVIQVARYSLRLAQYIDSRKDKIEPRDLAFLLGICGGNTLKGAIDVYEIDSKFIKIDRHEVLSRFEVILPFIKEYQDIITYNREYKVQFVYEMLIAVLEMFHFYSNNPSFFNTDFVF